MWYVSIARRQTKKAEANYRPAVCFGLLLPRRNRRDTGNTAVTRISRASSPNMDGHREGKNKTKQVRASCLFKTSEFIYFGCGLMIQRRRPLTAVLCGNTLFIFLIRPRGNMPLLAKGLNQIPLNVWKPQMKELDSFSPPAFPPCWISRLKYAEAHFIVETISF